MPDGFGIVPEELRQTAGRIGDVIAGVAGAVWQGPSDDYGHPGVQMGWAGFIDQMKAHVETLRAKADGHGENLITAAASYLDRESGVGQVLGQAGSLLESAAEVLGGGRPTSGAHLGIAQRLNPGGM
ncbi:hypothetical protein JOF56_008364 [Kibdelosporangium banguiense]|uniref:WXG100 family type VII secretion target n=1 Tax=Kibdelosporangium banguiense TaxID=1365924 RepID=A0ABS4TU81_9PSEU|nr:hypothetical protein [Kibdelosporangium banguiense]MBP2327979.1 hypothetical protein [Kibdelosporangium banguiense]